MQDSRLGVSTRKNVGRHGPTYHVGGQERAERDRAHLRRERNRERLEDTPRQTTERTILDEEH
jgi:hypothetical protein